LKRQNEETKEEKMVEIEDKTAAQFERVWEKIQALRRYILHNERKKKTEGV